jgi:hypothetical protein
VPSRRCAYELTFKLAHATSPARRADRPGGHEQLKIILGSDGTLGYAGASPHHFSGCIARLAPFTFHLSLFTDSTGCASGGTLETGPLIGSW